MPKARLIDVSKCTASEVVRLPVNSGMTFRQNKLHRQARMKTLPNYPEVPGSRWNSENALENGYSGHIPACTVPMPVVRKCVLPERYPTRVKR